MRTWTRAATPVLNAFTGKSQTWVADAVLKWAPGRQFRAPVPEAPRRVHAAQRNRRPRIRPRQRRARRTAYRSTQSGWYLQGVYQFRPRWRAGLRYDALDSGTPQIGLVTSGALTAADFPTLLQGDPSRTTVMLDWNPSEFSRLRLQYAWDDARDDGDTDRQLQLQYLYGIGAHGAHKY